jgi:hypothetical protein
MSTASSDSFDHFDTPGTPPAEETNPWVPISPRLAIPNHDRIQALEEQIASVQTQCRALQAQLEEATSRNGHLEIKISHHKEIINSTFGALWKRIFERMDGMESKHKEEIESLESIHCQDMLDLTERMENMDEQYNERFYSLAKHGEMTRKRVDNNEEKMDRLKKRVEKTAADNKEHTDCLGKRMCANEHQIAELEKATALYEALPDRVKKLKEQTDALEERADNCLQKQIDDVSNQLVMDAAKLGPLFGKVGTLENKADTLWKLQDVQQDFFREANLRLNGLEEDRAKDIGTTHKALTEIRDNLSKANEKLAEFEESRDKELGLASQALSEIRNNLLAINEDLLNNVARCDDLDRLEANCKDDVGNVERELKKKLSALDLKVQQETMHLRSVSSDTNKRLIEHVTRSHSHQSELCQRQKMSDDLTRTRVDSVKRTVDAVAQHVSEVIEDWAMERADCVEARGKTNAMWKQDYECCMERDELTGNWEPTETCATGDHDNCESAEIFAQAKAMWKLDYECCMKKDEQTGAWTSTDDCATGMHGDLGDSDSESDDSSDLSSVPDQSDDQSDAGKESEESNREPDGDSNDNSDGESGFDSDSDEDGEEEGVDLFVPCSADPT